MKLRLLFLAITLTSGYSLLAQWESLGNPGFSNGQSDYVNIAFDQAGTAYVSYQDWTSSGIVIVKKFDGTNWQDVGSNISPVSANSPSMTINKDTIYVAFADSDNSGKVTVKKFNGSTWDTIGIPGFSTFSADEITLKFDQDTAYVSYIRSASGPTGDKANVMKYDGTNWVIVGSTNFTTSDIEYLSFDIENGTPYVAFATTPPRKPFVMKYDGTSWVDVGGLISGGITRHTEILVLNGDPYVSMSSSEWGGKAIVTTFDGTNWIDYGTTGFSDNTIEHSSIVNDGDTIYLAYEANISSHDGTDWSLLTSTEYTSGSAVFIDMAIHNGVPYVAFRDNNNSDKVTVEKFVGTVGIPFSQFDNEANIYPNPTSGQLIIDITNQTNVEVKIYNTLGNLVFTQLSSGQTSIAIDFPSTLENGVYFVKVVDEKSVKINKLILER